MVDGRLYGIRYYFMSIVWYFHFLQHTMHLDEAVFVF
jgi:hypothetical protein